MTFTPEPFRAPHEPSSGLHTGQPGALAEPHQTIPPADWYADPAQPGTLRYWDGTSWTSHTVPGPPPASTAQPTFATFDSTGDQGSTSPRRARRRRLSVIGGVAGGIGAILAIRLIGIGGFDAVSAFFTTFDPEPLTAHPSPDWVPLDILEGHGTVLYDPTWAAADVDLAQMTEEASTGPGPDVHVDAAWVIDTDDNGNQSILYVYSAHGLAGLAQPELEVDAMIENSFVEKTGLETVSERAIVTMNDVRGYESEFEYDYFGWHYMDSAAVVVHGKDEVILYVSSGSEETGSGIRDLEAVLNSLSIG